MKQEFETDFWKDAQSRMIWEDMVPGEPRRSLIVDVGGDSALWSGACGRPRG